MEIITAEQGTAAIETIVAAITRRDFATADRLAAGLDEAAFQGDDIAYGVAYGIFRERASR